jgi:hypothetical protein
MACPARSAHGAPIVEGALDRLPTVVQFRAEYNGPAGIIHEHNSSGTAPGIDLHAQRFQLWRRYPTHQDDGEGVALEHCGFSLLEQPSRSARMDRVEWVLVRIQDKNV